MTTRSPAVAGSFYPKDRQKLLQELSRLFNQVSSNPPRSQSVQAFTVQPKALIAPHAGYIYSGPIAATAYNTLRQWAEHITRVVLLGPSHRVGFRGIASPGCDFFETPLGEIEVDHTAIALVANLDGVVEMPTAHAYEHSLEVQLPFLQTVLGEFKLVPLVVGDANAEEVANVLECLWGGEETLIVISSDLSHYHPYREAQDLDKNTSEAIENFNNHLHGEQACGCRPINGLLTAAKRHQLHLTTLDLRNSGDTAGSKHQVVGYGAYVLH